MELVLNKLLQLIPLSDFWVLTHKILLVYEIDSYFQRMYLRFPTLDIIKILFLSFEFSKLKMTSLIS